METFESENQFWATWWGYSSSKKVIRCCYSGRCVGIGVSRDRNVVLVMVPITGRVWTVFVVMRHKLDFDGCSEMLAKHKRLLCPVIHSLGPSRWWDDGSTRRETERHRQRVTQEVYGPALDPTPNCIDVHFHAKLNAWVLQGFQKTEVGFFGISPTLLMRSW